MTDEVNMLAIDNQKFSVFFGVLCVRTVLFYGINKFVPHYIISHSTFQDLIQVDEDEEGILPDPSEKFEELLSRYWVLKLALQASFNLMSNFSVSFNNKHKEYYLKG